MKITYKINDHFEKIDRENTDDFAKDIIRLEEGDFEEIEVDFEGIEYLSSMGIGVLFSLAQGLKERKARLKFLNLNPTMQKVFDMAGLNTYLEN